MKKMKKIIAAILATACTFSALSMTACEETNEKSFLDTVKGWFDKTDEEPSETPDDGAGETPNDGKDDGAGETPEDGKDDGAGETPDDGAQDDGAGDNTDEPTSGGNISTTDGVQYLRAGGTYALSKSAAFLSTDIKASGMSYHTVSVWMTAVVTPEDAYQYVDWTYEFVNASSSWAKGKKVSDYLTITPQADGSRVLRVTCQQPFGEQIKITCTSRANSNIKASTVVDFLGIPELQTVMLGSGSNAITVNLGGETTVKFDYDGTHYGGDLAVGSYKASTASVYTKLATVDDFDVFNFDLLTPGIYYNRDVSEFTDYEDGYLTAEVHDNLKTMMGSKTYKDDLGVYFVKNQEFFNTGNLEGNILVAYTTMMSSAPFIDALNEYEHEDVMNVLNSITENSLYTFVLHVEIGGAVQTYYSLMKLQIV